MINNDFFQNKIKDFITMKLFSTSKKNTCLLLSLKCDERIRERIKAFIGFGFEKNKIKILLK